MKKFSELLRCASVTNIREQHDFYQTPHECTQALIAAEGDRLPAILWDPCCGKGDIAIVLEHAGRKVVSMDLVDRGYGCGGIDFRRQETPLAAAIVTNPPFKHAEAMLRHAVAIGIEYLVFLHKAQWPNTVERRRLFGEVWCPVRSYHLEWRPDFTGQGAPTMDCNWWVFERRSMKQKSWTSSVLQKPAMALRPIL